MNRYNDNEIRVAAEAALREASICGDTTGSEAYLKALARESLAAAGIDPQWLPEQPMRDSIVAATMEESEGLVLFEIEFIWAVCRAIAQGRTSWRAALVPPFHIHHHPQLKLFFGTPLNQPKDTVMVRGWGKLELETWKGHIAAEAQFAQIFATALSEVSDRFAGMVQTTDELRSLAGDGPVGQIRIVERHASDAYHDPVGQLQITDDLWAAEKDLGHRSVDVIAWQCSEVNGRGYDLGHLRGDPELLSSLDIDSLREIVQLPEGEDTQLFIWDSSYSGPVEMTTMRDDATTTVPIIPAELRFRLDFTPAHYSYEQPDIRMATLGSLVRRIQRGTRMNGKSLKSIGTVSDPRPDARYDFGTMGYYSESDLYYVDNASFSSGTIRPRVIEEIPAGQERYTLLPEDGTVVLVARNGKGVAYYTPRRPTLVSNNLFIVWPDLEKAAPEYLSCALNGAVGHGQMNAMRMPMGRSDLERILVPVGPKELMDAVVEREAQIGRELAELSYKLDLLRIEDPLDKLWAKGVSAEASVTKEDGQQ